MATLYIVATPIGNLEDITDRARRVLAAVDLIAAEDTRHTGKLLSLLAIKTPLIAYHEHNELAACQSLVDRLQAGTDIALVSDAGTPLINDPGYRLVKLARDSAIDVVPIPGPCAIITALSAAGLPTDQFSFLGFLPAKSKARKTFLQQWLNQKATLVFYESPHRIVKSMASIREVFGEQRLVCIARELTKTYEQIVSATVNEICQMLDSGQIVAKGEFVVMLQGQQQEASQFDERELLSLLLPELPMSRAAEVAARLTGQPKKALYQLALTMKESK